MKLVPITAIVCITGLEGIALWQGIDGVLFGVAIAAISGLGGYQVKALRNQRAEEKKTKEGG